MFMPTMLIIGCAYRKGEGTPIDMDKALACFVLAAEQKEMNSIFQAILIYQDKMKKEGMKYMYEAIYYCRKYIKLRDTEKFDEGQKQWITETLSALSSMCRVCGKKGERYKHCSRCTCVYYCSVDCQRKDWKENGHKEECNKAIRPPTSSSLTSQYSNQVFSEVDVKFIFWSVVVVIIGIVLWHFI